MSSPRRSATDQTDSNTTTTNMESSSNLTGEPAPIPAPTSNGSSSEEDMDITPLLDPHTTSDSAPAPPASAPNEPAQTPQAEGPGAMPWTGRIPSFFIFSHDGRMIPHFVDPPGETTNTAAGGDGTGNPAQSLGPSMNTPGVMPIPDLDHMLRVLMPHFGGPVRPDPEAAAELLDSLSDVSKPLLKRVERVVMAEQADNGEDEDERGWKCGVCLEGTDWDEKEPGVKALPCNHLFHGNCLRPWFETKHTWFDLDPLRTLGRQRRRPAAGRASSGSGRQTPHPYNRTPTGRPSSAAPPADDPDAAGPAQDRQAERSTSSLSFIFNLQPEPTDTPSVAPPNEGQAPVIPQPGPATPPLAFGTALHASPLSMLGHRSPSPRSATPAASVSNGSASAARPHLDGDTAPVNGGSSPAVNAEASQIPIVDEPLPRRHHHIHFIHHHHPAGTPHSHMAPFLGMPNMGVPSLSPVGNGTGTQVPGTPQNGFPPPHHHHHPHHVPLHMPQPHHHHLLPRPPSAHPPGGTPAQEQPGSERTSSDPHAADTSSPTSGAPTAEAAAADTQATAPAVPASAVPPHQRDGFNIVFHFSHGAGPGTPPAAPTETPQPPPEPVKRPSLSEWVASREKALGWRCDAPECSLAPTDDDDDDITMPLATDKELISIFSELQPNTPPAAQGFELHACEHRWHRACLGMSNRSSGRMMQPDAEGRQWVKCETCRKDGWVRAPRYRAGSEGEVERLVAV